MVSMRFLVAFALCVGGCNCSSKNNAVDPDAPPGECDPACSDPLVCRYNTCVPPPTPCTSNAECNGDQYCDVANEECLPWGVGPGGGSDPECKREPVPGVFFPGAQCEWLGPPAGDPFPDHKNVLATPMVGSFYLGGGEFIAPSVVFTSYNFTDGGSQSCQGTDPNFFGVIRIIDGKTCTQQASIAVPTVIASSSLAIADLGGNDIPEIVAARTDGGLVAFTMQIDGSWAPMWETVSTFANDNCNWAGPSIHDLDDDGLPEVLFYGNVYDGATGAVIDESLSAAAVDSFSTGYIPVAADIDGDANPDLITGTQIYTWDKVLRKWTPKQALPFQNGHTAVADFGTFPASGADDRATLDGIAEIAVVVGGVAKVFNLAGREVFTANLLALGGGPVGAGGPPTIADFDGDGRVEFASAGASAYNVFDLDCRGTPEAATCPSLRTDGISWVQQSQDFSSNRTGSSVFDFDGDQRAEVVYGDECFTRVYDGITGKVVYSRFRSSCTWYENPIVVDTDADFNAEIVFGSNDNCNVVCPLVDPIFDGVQCLDDSDCPSATSCGREDPGDALGRCRCAIDDDCGGDGFVCLDPIAGPSAAGKVCRASHPATTDQVGIRILADSVDRWTSTRSIWNQHAYSVTNIDQAGKVPRTSEWLQNWKQAGLNNYRQNSPGEGIPPGAVPDLTIKQASAECLAITTVSAEVCNRGTEPVAEGIPVSFYAANTMVLRCTAETTERMFPGICTTVSCNWGGAPGDGIVVVDDNGDGSGINLECREDNNQLAFAVCP